MTGIMTRKEWQNYCVTGLLAEGRKQERERIAAWLRKNNAEICDWSPTTIAAAIIDGEHWQ